MPEAHSGGGAFDQRDFLSRQAVEVLHKPVNFRVRGVNLALHKRLLRARFRGGKLLLQSKYRID